MKNLGKKILMAAVAATIISACSKENDKVLPFSVLKSGDYSSVDVRSVVRVTNENELAALWTQMNSSQTPVPPAPQIDFNKEMSLFIFLGTRPTAGIQLS